MIGSLSVSSLLNFLKHRPWLLSSRKLPQLSQFYISVVTVGFSYNQHFNQQCFLLTTRSEGLLNMFFFNKIDNRTVLTTMSSFQLSAGKKEFFFYKKNFQNVGAASLEGRHGFPFFRGTSRSTGQAL